MLKLKLDDNVRVSAAGVAPADRAAGTVNGTAIDQLARTSYEECLAILSVGAASGSPTAQSVTLKIQESDDNSTFADVSGLSTAITTDSTVGTIHFRPGKIARYWRPVIVTAFTDGTSPAIESAVALVEYGPAQGAV